jgi:hypothetical protein
MTNERWIERNMEGNGCGIFKGSSPVSPVGTEENEEKFESGWSVSFI